MRNRNNNNRNRYLPPAGIPEQKHTEIVSRVLAILNEMTPPGGYTSGPIQNKDKPALEEVLDYLASEGIRPITSPNDDSVYAPGHCYTDEDCMYSGERCVNGRCWGKGANIIPMVEEM